MISYYVAKYIVDRNLKRAVWERARVAPLEYQFLASYFFVEQGYSFKKHNLMNLPLSASLNGLRAHLRGGIDVSGFLLAFAITNSLVFIAINIINFNWPVLFFVALFAFVSLLNDDILDTVEIKNFLRQCFLLISCQFLFLLYIRRKYSIQKYFVDNYKLDLVFKFFPFFCFGGMIVTCWIIFRFLPVSDYRIKMLLMSPTILSCIMLIFASSINSLSVVRNTELSNLHIGNILMGTWERAK